MALVLDESLPVGGFRRFVRALGSVFRRKVGPTAPLERRFSGSGSPIIVQQLPLSQQFQRIGGGLTPQDVSIIMREADSGVMSRIVDLANEARQKDGHLQCILYTREAALSVLPWRVSPTIRAGKTKPTARDTKVSAFVSHAIRQSSAPMGQCDDVRGFADLVMHLSGGIFFPFSVSEIVWRRDGGKLVPGGFNLLSQRRFRFDETSGKLLWWDSGMASGVDFCKKHPARFIVHQPRINGDVPVREGLMRVLIWAALFRNWSLSDWLKAAELSWKPWRLGVYKKSASEHDIDHLTRVLEELTTSGVATLPETTELQLLNAGGSGQQLGSNGARGNHQALCEFLAAEMSKAVLGQTLTTEAGARGARSLGEVHDRVRKDYLEADAVSLSATIQRYLVEPIVRLNFGDGVPVPKFEFVTQDSVNLSSFSDAMGNLVEAGLDIPQKWVRDQAGIPEPEGDEPLLGPNSVDVDVSELDEPETDATTEDDVDADDEEQLAA